MVKKNNKKAMIIYPIIFALSVMIFLFFYLNSESIQSNLINLSRQVVNNDHLDINFFPILEDLDGGISLGVKSDSENPLDEDFGQMSLQTPQDALIVSIGNQVDSSLDFILKIFYNYEEVAFRVLGAENYDTELLLSIAGGYQADIPIHLDESFEENEMINKLTVGIFIAPDQLAMVEEDLTTNYGLVLNFDINYGSDDELILFVEETEPLKQIEGLMFHSLMINQDFDPPAYAAYHPPNPLQVDPNEKIELAFVANGSSLVMDPLNSYLIISMLDWHQIPMNGDPYLLVYAEDKDVGQHGRFFIEAPDQPGFYEFVAFIVPNPTNENSRDNFFPLDISFRFTIEVTEEN